MDSTREGSVAGRREPPHLREHDAERIFIEARGVAELAQAQPELVERDAVDVRPEVAERMDVAIADPPPIAELDAEFDRGLGRLHERRFADVQRTVEIADVRKRGLADSHGSDFIRLDQLDRNRQALELVGERRRGHPSGRAPSHDAYSFDLHASGPTAAGMLRLPRR